MTIPSQLETLAVIGNGIIGHGIAQIFAAGGVNVRLIGKSETSLANAREKIKASLAQFVAHELLTAQEADAALQRIVASTSLHDAAGTEMVIEAVTENLALKHEIFGQLDAM